MFLLAKICAMGLPGRIKPFRGGAKSMDYVIDLDPTHLILRSSTTGGSGLALQQKSAVC
jgi:hypothetical protein